MIAATVMPIALATMAATMAGGLFALKLGPRLPMILGFSAGAVLGVAFFDLLPEALAAGGRMRNVLAVAAAGFFLYALLDRVLALHDHGKANSSQHARPQRGWIGAASFSAHSVLDGLALGLAFQAGNAVGLVVAAGVLAHDFSDGINTVNLVCRNGGSRAGAMRWLWADALAPVAGAGLSLFITLPGSVLSLVLAMFAGFFLYIGAGDLLPEAVKVKPRILTTAAMLLGAGVIWLAVQLAG
jgi:ZIP family zinc transporter